METEHLIRNLTYFMEYSHNHLLGLLFIIGFVATGAVYYICKLNENLKVVKIHYQRLIEDNSQCMKNETMKNNQNCKNMLDNRFKEQFLLEVSFSIINSKEDNILLIAYIHIMSRIQIKILLSGSKTSDNHINCMIVCCRLLSI